MITVNPTRSPTRDRGGRGAALAAIEGPSSASRSSSRTTSTRPAWRRPPARGRSPAATPSDAFIVGRLKAAGAIILAKANLSEWANFRSGPSSSGWSGIGGQTNMAYVLDRNPCGSSSGSGVAASADLATVAVGTETDGSIVCPSGANGDRRASSRHSDSWSRPAIVPISADQDTAGPIARNVTDAAVLLGAGVGVDPHDAATAAQAGHAFTDYTRFLDAGALKGARIGVWRALRPDVAEPATSSRSSKPPSTKLKASGRRSSIRLEIDFGTAFDAEFAALLCEFKTDIASYLATYTAAGYPKTLQDLIDFNNAHGPRGPRRPTLEQRRLRPGRGDRRQGRSRLRGAARRDDPGRPGGDRRRDGREQPRRDRRPDEQSGVGDRSGQR